MDFGSVSVDGVEPDIFRRRSPPTVLIKNQTTMTPSQAKSLRSPIRLRFYAEPRAELAAVPLKLLAHDASHGVGEGFVGGDDELPQCGVDQRLVAASAGALHPPSKPLEHIIVEANRDASLAWRRLYERASSSLREVVLSSHHPS